MQAIIARILSLIMALLTFLGFGQPKSSLDADTYQVNGRTVTFCFYSNPSTGYAWTAETDGDCVLLTGDEFRQTPGTENLAGAGGKQYYTFKAVKEGTATIVFTYARSWEKTEYDRTVTAVINVDSSLKVTVVQFTVPQ